MKIKVKIILDVVMTAVLILLLDKTATGMSIHESAGIAIFGLFIIHKLLNLSAIKGMLKSAFSRKGKPRIIAQLIIDAALSVGISLTVLSGVFISEKLFPSLSVHGFAFWKVVHSPAAYWSLILASAHLGMHWKYIIAIFRKMLKITNDNPLRKAAVRLCALILAVLGVRASFNVNMMDKLAITSSSSRQQQRAYASVTAAADELNGGNEGIVMLSSSSADPSGATQTLDDYLGSLHCTACHRHCSLLSPHCGRGKAQAAQAETEYYQTISNETTAGDAAASDTANTSDSASPDAETSATQKQDGASPSSSQTTQASETQGTEAQAGQTDGASSDGTESGAAATSTAQPDSLFPEDGGNEGFQVSKALSAGADYIPIMSLYVAGTHYIVSIPGRRKKTGDCENQ